MFEGPFSLWVSLMAMNSFSLSLPTLITTLSFNGVIKTREPSTNVKVLLALKSR